MDTTPLPGVSNTGCIPGGSIIDRTDSAPEFAFV